MSDAAVLNQIKSTVESNDVVLYMKGTRMVPQCGFSGGAVQILSILGADFKDVNVLADPEVRQGIKDYANWPTIPQLYVKGEFVGGFDIMKEMYETGELEAYLVEKGVLANA